MSAQKSILYVRQFSQKWDKTKQGIFKWNHQIRLDVEDSISFATSYENFLKLMELKGYEIKQESGETFLKPMGEKGFIRLTDILSYYTLSLAKVMVFRQKV